MASLGARSWGFWRKRGSGRADPLPPRVQSASDSQRLPFGVRPASLEQRRPDRQPVEREHFYSEPGPDGVALADEPLRHACAGSASRFLQRRATEYRRAVEVRWIQLGGREAPADPESEQQATGIASGRFGGGPGAAVRAKSFSNLGSGSGLRIPRRSYERVLYVLHSGGIPPCRQVSLGAEVGNGHRSTLARTGPLAPT
jgi:hypothetical protein